ncbi:GNAT family N-acetyltransferase [Malacoplasma muris]|uniref:GNAT family N-acetyltransferase n=1 Tax=Malacoplasma muris TaxID=2119 RepID=UPI00398F144E
MATIEIRNVTQNEKEEILKLARNLVEEYEDKNSLNYNQMVEKMRAGINQRIVDFKSIWFDRQLAGYFHIGKKDEQIIEVYFLYVYENFRKKHIGSQVLEHAVIQASNRNKILQIQVSENNAYAIKFLTEFGFKKTNSNDSNVVVFEVDARKKF